MATVNTARRRVGAVAVFVIIGITACGDDSKSDSSGTAPVETAPAAAIDDSGSLGGGEATGQNGTDPAPLTPVTTRKLVITMSVGLEVDDAAAAVDEVVRLAADHDGQLYDSSVDLGDPRYAGGDLVFKLPPDEVDGFLTGLDPAIGRRTSLRGDTQDVTEQLSDLDARIDNARASVERVRALMDRATTLGEVVTLEGELTTRETHLEELLAQQANLQGLVAMATITVHLSTAPPPEPDSDATHKDSIGDAFRDGWHAFVAVVRGVVLFVGYTLPFLLIAGVCGLVGWRLRRTSRSRAAARPRPPAPGAGPHTSSPDSADVARIP